MIELVKDKEAEMHLEGRPLVLIPLVFARGVLMGESEDERRWHSATRRGARPRCGPPTPPASTDAWSCCSATVARRSCARSTGPRRRPTSPAA